MYLYINDEMTITSSHKMTNAELHKADFKTTGNVQVLEVIGTIESIEKINQYERIVSLGSPMVGTIRLHDLMKSKTWSPYHIIIGRKVVGDEMTHDWDTNADYIKCPTCGSKAFKRVHMLSRDVVYTCEAKDCNHVFKEVI